MVPCVLRHLGGGSGVSVRLEAVECAKTLMRVNGPAQVARVLLTDNCLNAKSSKLRENSLLWLMYALMTFPSGEFDLEAIAEAVLRLGAVEPKRRVRQSLLDAVAVLGQFVSRAKLRLQNPAQIEGGPFYNEALQARLARRQLPTVSPEGLILYALQVPHATEYYDPLYDRSNLTTDQSRWNRYIGPDVEWVLAGSGSLSAGSARSRAQLDNAQRGFISPTQSTDNVYSVWSGNQDIMAVGVGVPQRNVQHDGIVYTNDDRTYYEDAWSGNQLEEPASNKHHLSSSPHQGTSRPLYLRFQTGHGEAPTRANYSTDRGFPQLSTSYGGMNQYQHQLRRSGPEGQSVFMLNNSWGGGGTVAGRRGLQNHQPPPHVSFSSANPPPPLPPLPNWKNSSTTSLHQLQVDVGPRILPNMEHRQGRWSRRQDNDPSRNRLLSINGAKENGTVVHKSILSRQKSERSRSVESFGDSAGTSNAVASAPAAVSILASPTHHRHSTVTLPFSKHEESAAPEVDIEEETTVVRADRALGTEGDRSRHLRLPQVLQEEAEEAEEEHREAVVAAAEPVPEETEAIPEAEPREEPEQPPAEPEDAGEGPESAVPQEQETREEAEARSPERDPTVLQEQSERRIEQRSDSGGEVQEVETLMTNIEQEPTPPSTVNTTDGKSLGSIGSEFDSVDSGNHTYSTDAETIEKSIDLPKRKISRPFESRLRQKRSFGSNESKIDNNLYPDNLAPFAQTKEGLAKTLLQLENPEWEVVMQGLQGLVRLGRHHPRVLQPISVLHPAVVLLTRHVKNLRSQVARSACQATQHLFTALGRSLDAEVEDLAGALLSRMGDTNKFLRADAMAALDTMVRNVSPIKSVSALINKGAKHQNALVRGATSRLLLVVCSKLGPERTLSLPRETRDSLILTGAKMLQEGSLDTRRYAKEMFTLLSADPRLHGLMTNVIPSNIMRNISKVMARINCK